MSRYDYNFFGKDYYIESIYCSGNSASVYGVSLKFNQVDKKWYTAKFRGESEHKDPVTAIRLANEAAIKDHKENMAKDLTAKKMTFWLEEDMWYAPDDYYQKELSETIKKNNIKNFVDNLED